MEQMLLRGVTSSVSTSSCGVPRKKHSRKNGYKRILLLLDLLVLSCDIKQNYLLIWRNHNPEPKVVWIFVSIGWNSFYDPGCSSPSFSRNTLLPKPHSFLTYPCAFLHSLQDATQKSSAELNHAAHSVQSTQYIQFTCKIDWISVSLFCCQTGLIFIDS